MFFLFVLNLHVRNRVSCTLSCVHTVLRYVLNTNSFVLLLYFWISEFQIICQVPLWYWLLSQAFSRTLRVTLCTGGTIPDEDVWQLAKLHVNFSDNVRDYFKATLNLEKQQEHKQLYGYSTLFYGRETVI